MEENGDDKSSLISSPKEEEEEESPVRAVVCLKSKEEIKHFEETEDCFILDFDPSEPPQLSKISMEKNVDAVDVSVVAEKGPAACRDYPHSRHLCLKFPFTATLHESFCEMCYCYVCDSAAPCKYWNQPIPQHCDADGAPHWKDLRRQAIKKVAAKQELLGTKIS